MCNVARLRVTASVLCPVAGLLFHTFESRKAVLMSGRYVQETRPPSVALALCLSVRTCERDLGFAMKLDVVIIVKAVQERF
jgi:hypothetical protein